ncbi:extracellular solute-binding protein [Paenibacillus sp. 19GGS1-52]|uniref:ABC transporter substrate-binding protein n=1 Tax=Paenibacillus sp. 19GGS1-52 TaxID=2758563 RepID=UPI001EFB399A|nr:extracellular solute-binding protein [Paenibacillus sp. 19GGS1-52]ULO05404.1 extracellular solute-binding protein [Paenibacillus sp. 19GGS1-52]
MKITFKNVISILVTSALVFTIAGCGGNDTEVVKSTDKQITLNFIWWGKPSRKEITLKVIAMFEKANPNIKFKTEDYSSNANVATKLAMYTADQTMPDLIQADYSFIFNYIKHDLLEPMDSFSKSKVLDLSDIDKSFLVSGQYKGLQYGIPMGSNALAIAYDPAMFKEYGIEPLQNGYSVDDLQHTMQLFKEKVNTPDFYPLDIMFDVSYWLRTKGESFYNKEGTGLGYTDKSIIEYLTLMKKWMDTGLLKPSNAVTSPTTDETNALVTGKTAFLQISSNLIVSLGDAAGRTLKLLSLPTYDGEKEGSYIKPSMFIAVSSYSEHTEAAAKFIDFITNNKEANDILRGDRGVPIATQVAAQLSSQANEQGKEQFTYMSYIAKHSSPIDPPAPQSDGVVQNAYQIMLNDVVEGKTTPEKAASSFRTEAEHILGQVGGSK